MAPHLREVLPREALSFGTASSSFKSQWSEPSDIFSLLLILGGDVVRLALAQLAGSYLTPVAFSFGWVAYSISALVAALGCNKLMPPTTDYTCKVINGTTGYARDNTSFVISRVVRDLDHWAGRETLQRLEKNINDRWEMLKQCDAKAAKPARAGLVVSVFKPSETIRAGVQRRDWLYWSGIVTIIVQHGLAALPLGLYGDWGVLLLTGAGTLLSLITGCLPQWRREKWACRERTKSSFILTEGNGAQHAIVILGNGHGLDLEDLATGQTIGGNNRANTTWLHLTFLVVLWVLLLITSMGVRQHTWYLVVMGSLGMLQNAVVAGAARKPEAHGIPLDFVNVIGNESVMQALFEVESVYPGIGQRLRTEFFPGKLKEEELQTWRDLELTESARREQMQAPS